MPDLTKVLLYLLAASLIVLYITGKGESKTTETISCTYKTNLFYPETASGNKIKGKVSGSVLLVTIEVSKDDLSCPDGLLENIPHEESE
jgi:hypothetical protein